MNRNERPKITIVTPSFNQGQFIEPTIQSVLSQDYPDLEYMIIDGGSTDKSIEIIKKYEDRIALWKSEKDNGQSDAIQKGLDLATGEVFAWQNSDDVYAPRVFGAVADIFAAFPGVDIVFGGWRFIDTDGNVLTTRSMRNYSLRKLRSGWGVPPQPAVFMRTSAVRRAGGIDQSKRYVMDYALYVRMAGRTNVSILDMVCGDFRMHASSKTVSETVRHIRELVQTREELLGSTASIADRVAWLFYDRKRQIRDALHNRMGFFSFKSLVRKRVGAK
jgi:glycosyltransferase involved in cell wall biosynthesis